jgi:lipopolysaccharide transport system ATP-binding protein
MTHSIYLQSVSKTYRTYKHGWDRLMETITNRSRAQLFKALHPLTLEIPHGQVVGIVGDNGAGKSTLLKIVADTLICDPSGKREVSGRIAALLELGSGFHPEMSGRENVYLSGAMMGIPIKEIDKLYDNIVAFAGIEEFMEQPVKTYSSGMFMRLAFAVATSVDPDILIIDEALSVGDGTFARKSFDRIMQFREAQKTILFCSHSLYQVEKICDRVIWLDKGRVMMDGVPSQVLTAYNETLNTDLLTTEQQNSFTEQSPELSPKQIARITSIKTYTESQNGNHLILQSGKSHLSIDVEFIYDPSLPPPAVAVTIVRKDNFLVSSAITHNDGTSIPHNSEGKGHVRIVFQKIPLLKGNYIVNVFLGCENAILLYDHAQSVASLTVEQEGIEQGIVNMPHKWQTHFE